jgi:glycosyltransferase involved in cell wall biosynthesis
MASGLGVVLRAAKILKDKGRNDVRLMLVGDGATRQDLEQSAKQQGLDNVVFTGRLDKKLVPRVLATVDSCLVHLRKQELFESVLPSKMFEACGMAKPIILGVKGCAAKFLNEANAGICMEPENEHDLVAAIEKLAADRQLAESFGRSGQAYVRKNFDRDKLSRDYFNVIRYAIESCPIVV